MNKKGYFVDKNSVNIKIIFDKYYYTYKDPKHVGVFNYLLKY